jgi:hypothetical protein
MCDPDNKQRFLAKVQKNECGCWIWNGSKTAAGYGMITIKGVVRYAHRMAYEEYRGPITGGMFVCHRCDNPSCVNPDHLFLGTNNENVADMVAKQRQAKGERVQSSKLTEDKVAIIRSSTKLQRELAQEFGVSQSLISMVRSRQLWAHI